MSTSIFCLAIGLRFVMQHLVYLAHRDGSLASSRLKAIPDIMACSILSFLGVYQCAAAIFKDESTRSGTLYLLANSTLRICKTLAPKTCHF